MPTIRETLARLRTLRAKFEHLLASARTRGARRRAAGPDRRPSRLRELTGFGTNPGKLRMFAYAPDHLPPKAPLVVALHGCTQSADDFDLGAGWSSLADEAGFVVVYPQQQRANNQKNCFTWFLPEHTARGRGEALSIKQIVEHALANFDSDRSKVFITGFSAGGAMASIMLATYPEVFSGGAIIAGLPYGCANNMQQAFEAMFSDKCHPGHELGDRVRGASGNRGSWPKLSVWHGTSDPIVKSSNSEEIIRQWTNLHGLEHRLSYQESNGTHTRRVWSDSEGNPLIEAFSITSMAHGVPLSTQAGRESCGIPGPFFLDVGISSTHHIARFFGLQDACAEVARTRSASKSMSMAVESGALLVPERVTDGLHSSADPTTADEGRRQLYPIDPNVVIAAAFKAAGLPVPEIPTTAAGAAPQVRPGPIIAAAWKAAGLVQR
jgi:poly(hydroxyalkanoate) depolymerase family esterase